MCNTSHITLFTINPTANGTTIQVNTITNTLMFPPFSAARGDTKPTKPNPSFPAVPTIFNIVTLNELIAAVIATGNPIIGFVKKFGIIIFIAPKPIATGTPALFDFIVAHTKNAAAEATPIPAAAEDIPFSPIAKPIATVDIGLIIIIENDTAIKILINIGCKLVNELIPCPITAVIIETYGNVNVPTNPTPAPTIIGIKTKFREPNLSPIHCTTKTAKAAVSIVLITSPIPDNWKINVGSAFPTEALIYFHAPDPINAAPPTHDD